MPDRSISFLPLLLALIAAPVAAEPRAKLVHCGSDTCLRVYGSRPHATVSVWIAGRAVSVQGATSWRVTLPLAATRAGVDASGERLMLALVDPRTGTEQVHSAMLPPGALGRPVELASLTVFAH